MVIAFRSNLPCFWEIWRVAGSIPRSGSWFFFFVQINFCKLFLYACILYNDKKLSKVWGILCLLQIHSWTVRAMNEKCFDVSKKEGGIFSRLVSNIYFFQKVFYQNLATCLSTKYTDVYWLLISPNILWLNTFWRKCDIPNQFKQTFNESKQPTPFNHCGLKRDSVGSRDGIWKTTSKLLLRCLYVSLCGTLEFRIQQDIGIRLYTRSSLNAIFGTWKNSH